MLLVLPYSLLLLLSLGLVVKSADYAIRYAARLAHSFNVPKYIIGFLVVAVLSILPETFIAITSALAGTPSLGLGTLFGSNVADLTLVFAFVVFLSGRNLKVENRIMKNRNLYVWMLMIPIIFGLNGYYSKIEGLTLVLIGIFFYLHIIKESRVTVHHEKERFSAQTMIFFIISILMLLLGSHFTVQFGVELATLLHINPTLIGLFVIGLGTTLPELFFGASAARHHDDGLALGDILGTVIADATIVVGIVALISPFSFDPKIVYVTGLFMIGALIILLKFMSSGRMLTKKEVLFLILFYGVFLITEIVTTMHI